jgi:hypothetical protein|tara:strand:+ start:374 stop:955 length:582 start_codon:yes stop_codon:yes gene_type:complete
MNFPAIIVERPHQTPGRAWIARDAEAITEELAGGENYNWDYYAEISDFTAVYGLNRDEWPKEARALSACDFPRVAQMGPGGFSIQPASEATSELDFALEYIGHDFHALNVLESAQEAGKLLEAGGHNVPRQAIREAMEELDWVNEQTSAPDVMSEARDLLVELVEVVKTIPAEFTGDYDDLGDRIKIYLGEDE